jgi:hypothetical protein
MIVCVCICVCVCVYILKVLILLSKSHVLHFCFRYAANAISTGFCRSTQFIVADFSFNFLVGSIPKCLEYLPRFLLLSLSHTCFLLGKSSFT